MLNRKRRNRRGIFDGAEKLDQGVVSPLLFQQAAGEAQLEDAVPQGVCGLRALPDEASQGGLDIKRSDGGNPCRFGSPEASARKRKSA